MENLDYWKDQSARGEKYLEPSLNGLRLRELPRDLLQVEDLDKGWSKKLENINFL